MAIDEVFFIATEKKMKSLVKGLTHPFNPIVICGGGLDMNVKKTKTTITTKSRKQVS